jgi:uncharacterized protein YyaL (SSP411 family)
MAHESFEDADVARVLNDSFVSIKVDREERPDIDRVYMMFVQATTGSGGWPMSVWLTPELKPFFGGTYFPPASKWGRPGFVEVLKELASAWRTNRDELVQSADSVLEQLRHAAGSEGSATERLPVAGRDALTTGIAAFAEAFDRRHGGFGGAPKFPRPAELQFLLEASALTGDWNARTMAVDTLRAMARGGMRDHLGGGFHRYSVDAEWRVPHFEKMLYDQAQLVLTYLDAAATTGDVSLADVAEDTLAYVRRAMRSADGAFYSAEDADSAVPGGLEADSVPIIGASKHAATREGAFYVWSAGEITRRLGDDAPLVARRFGIEPNGNALADPQGEFTGLNILYLAQEIDDIAARAGRRPEDVALALERAKQVLFEARERRPKPHLDDKIITAWNGLMIAAFARAAKQLVHSPHRAAWRETAESAARAIRSALWDQGQRRLFRRHRAGESGIDAFCEDYAYLTWGLVELFQATGHAEWLAWALDLTAVQTELFFDPADGGWFSTTGQDRSVLLRAKEDYDGAEPAAASVTVRNLMQLGHITGEPTLLERAERSLERYGPNIGRIVRVMPLMVANVALWHGGGTQVVISGAADHPETVALEQAAASRYVPWRITIPLRSAEDRQRLATVLPWLGGLRVTETAAAYLCDNFTCQAPTSDPAVLQEMLDGVLAAKKVGR